MLTMLWFIWEIYSYVSI